MPMLKISAASFCLAIIVLSSQSHGVVIGDLDRDQFLTNGVSFGEFDAPGNVDANGPTIKIDINSDSDGQNGYSGGFASAIFRDFDPNSSRLELSLTIDPDNVSNTVSVILRDDDDKTNNFTREEHRYDFDLTGQPTGTPITLTRDLSTGPDFTNPLPGFTPDGIDNYGMRAMIFATDFDPNNLERLKVDLERVEIIDTSTTTVAELTAPMFEWRNNSFAFNALGDPNALDTSGSTIIITADPNSHPTQRGGMGFNQLDFDFDAEDHQLEIEAKLLPGNAAQNFHILLGDKDGDQFLGGGAGDLGSEDFLFKVPTTAFDPNGFSTFTIPLGSGSESFSIPSFPGPGSNNGGDGLQNFDLSAIQIQLVGPGDPNDPNSNGDLGFLAIEIARVAVVESPGLAGDFNDDGSVDGFDFLAWQRGESPNPLSASDLADWEANYGEPTPLSAAIAAVPEPGCLLLGVVGAMVTVMPRRRKRVAC